MASKEGASLKGRVYLMYFGSVLSEARAVRFTRTNTLNQAHLTVSLKGEVPVITSRKQNSNDLASGLHM
jgi:hypothetical protein